MKYHQYHEGRRESPSHNLPRSFLAHDMRLTVLQNWRNGVDIRDSCGMCNWKKKESNSLASFPLRSLLLQRMPAADAQLDQKFFFAM